MRTRMCYRFDPRMLHAIPALPAGRCHETITPSVIRYVSTAFWLLRCWTCSDVIVDLQGVLLVTDGIQSDLLDSVCRR